MKWVYWIVILVVLLVVAGIVTVYINKKNKEKDKKQVINKIPLYMMNKKTSNANVDANVDANADKSQENYINFTFSNLSEYSEAKALQLQTSKHASAACNPKLFSKTTVLNKLSYVHNYENQIAVSNTLQLYNNNIYIGSPEGQFVNLNFIVNQPLLMLAIILPPQTFTGFYVDTKSKFPYFSADGIFTTSKGDKSSLVPTNNSGIYNIVGQDIHQQFIIGGNMTDVTMLFLGNLLVVRNTTNKRFYGALMVKPVFKPNLSADSGVALNINTVSPVIYPETSPCKN